MLQLKKSEFDRGSSSLVVSTYDIYRHVDADSDKRFTQKEVNDLLKINAVGYVSEESDKEKELKAIDKQRIIENKTIEDLVRKSNRIILSISSHAFPVELFPNTINIEEGRITIIYRHFLSSKIHSIDIRNISNIFINRTFLFSQLVIISKTYEENEIRVKNLRTSEAIYARRIIEGLRTFENKQIDTSHYSIRDLIGKLEQLSKTKIVT